MSASSILISILSIILIGGFVFSVLERRRKRRAIHDPRRYLHPNSTNYNFSMLDEEEIENCTPEQAREILEKAKNGELSSLSPRDFYCLKRKLKELEE
ncbi:MAG: hypothetical protein R3350_06240 [Saprospiraceae bacterium]|nr:hypothetical protein [Saprospiraceae bacterium]